LPQAHPLFKNREKEQHVAALLLFVLPVKSLIIKAVADVADFSDLSFKWRVASGEWGVPCENWLGQFMFLPPVFAFPSSIG
jgi:hypothetical protein